MKKFLSLFLTIFAIAAYSAQAQSYPQFYFRKVPTGLTLNAIVSGSVAAYSARQLRTGYSGAAVRVIKLSTSAESDLPLNFTQADALAISTRDDLEVVKWYDQSGNGRDLIFSATNRPKLSFLAKPAIDFGYDSSQKRGETAGFVAVSEPKIFMLADAPLNGGSFVSFEAGDKFNLLVNSQVFQMWNGTGVVFDAVTRRASRQITAYFQTGDEEMRFDGDGLSIDDETNAGDTSANGTIRLGSGNGGGGDAVTGNIGELIIFDGAVSDANRDFLEANQQNYFLNGNRLIVHGDSIGYGVGLTLFEEEFLNYGAIARDELGAGYDIYREAVPGWRLFDNLTPDIEEHIVPRLRADAQSNIILLNSGFNDFNIGRSVAQVQQDFLDYGDTLKANAVGNTRLAVSSVFPAAAIYEPADFGTKRPAINAFFDDYYFFFANAYIDTTGDADIGASADASTSPYWYDGVHLSAAGYERWGELAALEIAHINNDLTAPDVPDNAGSSSVTHNSATISWDEVIDGSLGGYRVQTSTAPDFSSNVTNTLVLAGTESGSITGLSELTTYYYRVAAVDASGNYSAYTTTQNFTTTADPAFWSGSIAGGYTVMSTTPGDPNFNYIECNPCSWQDVSVVSRHKIKFTNGYFEVVTHSTYPVSVGVQQESYFVDSIVVQNTGAVYEAASDTGTNIGFAAGDTFKFVLQSNGKIKIYRNGVDVYTSTISYSNTVNLPLRFQMGGRGDAPNNTKYAPPSFVP